MKKLIIKNRYATIPNDLVNSCEISLRAKGLFAFIQSKPDGWEFSAERISFQLKEGLQSVTSALKELENNGYLTRQKTQNEYGHWNIDYILQDIPAIENPAPGNPVYGNPTFGNPMPGKQPNNIKKEVNKKETEINTNKEGIFSFEELLEPHTVNLGSEYENFVSYWTEKDKKGKQRWEAEKFFDISRRIKTWIANKNKYNNDGNSNNKKRGTSIDRMEAVGNW
jgi:hypothetical protein